MSFVGADRSALVQRVEATFADAARTGEPRLVSLEAPQGWGKTRIVQAFYESLAGRQPAPPYWPPSLVTTGETDPLRLRKRVVPSHFNRGAPMPWMWWGLSCGRRQTHGLEHVLAEDAGQLELHLDALLATEADRDRLKQDFLQAVRSVVDLGLDALQVDTALTAGELLVNTSRLAVSAVRAGARAGDDAIPQVTAATDPGRAPLIERTVQLIATVGKRALPFVLVIDDVHDADPGVTGLLERIFRGPMPVPVVCILTGWPDRLGEQAARREGAGAWLQLACERDPGRCRREPLARLAASDLATLVRERAPSTSADVLGAFAQRADGNPLVLEGLLRVPRVARATRDGTITLTAADVARLENSLPSIMLARWEGLPLEVQEALCLCTLQGREAVESLVLHTYDVAVPEAAPDAGGALTAAVDPHAWVRRLGEVLRFHEQYTFEIARECLDKDHLTREAAAAAQRSIAARIAAWRADAATWRDVATATRQTLRAIHVEIARAGNAEDRASAASSAGELGVAALDGGQYPQARDLADLALEWIHGTPDAPRQLVLALRLLQARSSWAVGDLAAGRRLLASVATDAETSLSADHPIAIEARTNLARVLIESGDWEEARAMLARLIADSAAIMGADADNTLDARAHLAVATLNAGDFAEATALLDELLPDRERAFGTAHPDSVEIRLLRENLRMLDEPERAKAIYEDALRHAEEALGPDHPHVLDARSNLAAGLRDLGYYRDARALQEQTIADFERVLGERHQATLGERVNLAQTLVFSNDPGGTPMLREAASALEQALGATHPSTLSARRALAECLAEQGETERARLALEILLSDIERTVGARHPQAGATRRVLAGVALHAGMDDSGNRQQARDLLEQDYEERQRGLGPLHRITVLAGADLALARFATGERESGRELLDRLVGDLTEAHGSDAAETLAASLAAGRVLFRAGADEEAATVFDRVLSTRREQLGPEHPETIEAALALAAVLERHVPPDAQVLNEEAYESAKATYGLRHPVTAQALSRVADLALQLQDFERARAAWERLAAVRDDVLGPDHLSTLRARFYLAETLASLGERVEAKALMSGVVEGLQRILERAEADLSPQHPHTVALRSELAEVLDRLGATEAARDAAPVVGGTLSAPLPRRTYSVERLKLWSPDGLAEVTAETAFLPPGNLDVPRRRLRTALHWIVGYLVAFAIGAGVAATASGVAATVTLFVLGSLAWWLIMTRLLPVVFGLNPTPKRCAAVRERELRASHHAYTETALEPIRLGSGGRGLLRRFEVADDRDRRFAHTEVYSVHGWTVLTVMTSVQVLFAEDRSQQLERARSGIVITRPGVLPRLRRELLRLLGRARVAGAMRARLPFGWLSIESLTVTDSRHRFNSILSVEPIDPSFTTQENAELQGQRLADEFPGYEEECFEPMELFGGHSGYLRAFSWHAPEDRAITQLQGYFVETGRCYTATATSRTEDSARWRDHLFRQLREMGIDTSAPVGPQGTT